MNSLSINLKDKITIPKFIFGVAALVLAIDPVLWLIQTWRDPSYDSSGFFVFCICIGLFLWSVTSDRTAHTVNLRLPFILLAVSAFTRLVGQVLAINVIGAITLVLDVYAIGHLAAVGFRQRSISPGWLATCFAFSLPLERIIQRTMGYGLQSISADGACLVLGSIFDNVRCNGVRILIDHQDVLVDLPCSGARALLLVLLFYSACMTVCRPGITRGFFGLGITLLSGICINVIRIVVIATGIAYPKFFMGIDVMKAPWHDLLGLTFLAMGSLPVIYWASLVYNRQHPSEKSNEKNGRLELKPFSRLNTLWQAVGFLALATVIVSLPRKPIDVAKPNLKVVLPSYIHGNIATPVPLFPKEQAYFTKYGGAAAKAVYGEYGLLIVKTSAPLRHLHSPDDCLRGLGFDVEYIGVSHQNLPTAIYKATASDGASYRVAVSFVSSHGHIASNVSEAVWQWMQHPGGIWYTL
ncbi:MAG TPA: exosortase T, partial [Rhodospirillales bacterium]|nr:exosortase T [Rhodospirillales bacterium]